jgi:hypothetical protein
MKKIILFLALALCYNSIYSQKKKTPQKTTSSVLAKFENLSVEIIKNNLCLLILNKEAKKDTIVLKNSIENSLPKECKILPFSAKNVKLYNISWIENKVTETKLKIEDATTVFTEICELASKTKLLSNAQTTTKIKEIHFLDAKQTVSETIQKVRNEGSVLSLTKEGDVILKNKTQESRMIYNPTNNTFVNASISATKKKK